MAKKNEAPSSTKNKHVPMIQVNCKGTIRWANYAPKKGGYRCTGCGQVHS